MVVHYTMILKYKETKSRIGSLIFLIDELIIILYIKIN